MDGNMEHNMNMDGNMEHNMNMDGNMEHNMNMDGAMGQNMSMGGMMGHMAMMKMYFHVGDTAYVLFESCKTHNTAGIVGACIVMFLVGILYEGLKFARQRLLQGTLQEKSDFQHREKGNSVSPQASNETMITVYDASISQLMFSVPHIIQTFLHMVQIFVSYCLMLVFMTYNVWLCLSVILGAGVGYFLFGWKRAVVVDSNEHCH